jgi:hypothetical protein
MDFDCEERRKVGREAKQIQDCLVLGSHMGVSEDTSSLGSDAVSGE